MRSILIILFLSIFTVMGFLQTPQEGAKEDNNNEYFAIESSKFHHLPRWGKRPLEIHIDLDQHPTKRWTNVTELMGDRMKSTYTRYLEEFPVYLKYMFWVADKIFQGFIDNRTIVPAPIAEMYLEIKGMADSIGFKSYQLLLINFIFEINAHCTGIVTHDKDGHIIHGRNLDFPGLETMRNVSFQGNFYRDGKLKYNAVMMAGYTGVFTVMKPGAFAININERNTNIEAPFLTSLYAYFSAQAPPSHLMRRVCENAENFEEALESLKSELLTAPTYFILSGVKENEGAVIARDRNGLADVWRLNKDSENDSILIATNYDRWVAVPDHDKNRVNYVKHYIEQIGKDKLDKNNMMEQVLKQPMVLRSPSIHSVVMSARTDHKEGETSCGDCGGAYLNAIIYK